MTISQVQVQPASSTSPPGSTSWLTGLSLHSVPLTLLLLLVTLAISLCIPINDIQSITHHFLPSTTAFTSLIQSYAPGESYGDGDSSSGCSDVDGYQYFVYVDGGSSGTRIHIHKYTYNTTDNYTPIIHSHIHLHSHSHALPIIHSSTSYKVRPGLSHYASNSAALTEGIHELMNYAIQNVPHDIQHCTKLHVGATAGLRTLSGSVVDKILEYVASTIDEYNFKFHRSDNEYIQLIDGQQEGINGWIAANYLLNNFDVSPRKSMDDSIASRQTVGVIELGGASLQVTYAVIDGPDECHGTDGDGDGDCDYDDDGDIDVLQHYADEEQHSDMIDVSLGGNHYRVYTRSYLNYGLERAQTMLHLYYQQELLPQFDYNPCYISNTPDYAMPTALNAVKSMDASDSASSTSKCQQYRGNYDECHLLIHELLDIALDSNVNDSADHIVDVQHCPGGSTVCMLEPLSAPRIDSNQQFIAIENFFYTSEFFGIESDTHWLQKLKAFGQAFCSYTWQDAVERYSDEPSTDLSKYCFSSVYLPLLLEHGLQLHDTLSISPSSIKPMRTIDQHSIDWELGAVIRAILVAEHDHIHGHHHRKHQHQHNYSRYHENSLLTVLGSTLYSAPIAILLLTLLSLLMYITVSRSYATCLSSRSRSRLPASAPSKHFSSISFKPTRATNGVSRHHPQANNDDDDDDQCNGHAIPN